MTKIRAVPSCSVTVFSSERLLMCLTIVSLSVKEKFHGPRCFEHSRCVSAIPGKPQRQWVQRVLPGDIYQWC